MASERQALEALAILAGRENVLNSVLDLAFTEQQSFINDESTLKAALCSRRAGKTMATGISFLYTGLKYPGSNLLYIGLTRDAAKRTICKDVIDKLTKKLKLGLEFNKSTLTYTFPNGSLLNILGFNTNPEEADKVLGQKFKLVILDEGGSFKQDVELIINETLLPAIMDEQGQIVMIGTPQHNKNTLFYRVTTGLEAGWSVHKWDTWSNPHMSANQTKDLNRELEKNPNFKNTPRYRMRFLGEWVHDEEGTIYKFNRNRNVCTKELYEKDANSTIHILGVDLGYNDDSSFVVINYSNYREQVIVPYSYKRKNMDITDVANMIKALDAKFNFVKIVIDGSNRQAVEELRKRHGLSKLYAADKRGKLDFVELCNAELISKKILFTPDNTELFAEFESLIFDPRQLNKGIRMELSSCANHLCDGFLYAWRYTNNYCQWSKEPIVNPHSEEAITLFWEQECDKIEKDKNKPFWEE